MIKHPMVRILSCGILITSLLGSNVNAAQQTPTVSAESNYRNEQKESQNEFSHMSVGNNKILKDALIAAEEEQKIINTINKKGYTATSVNIRKKPSKNSKKLDTYKINTKIKYAEYNNDWVMILYEDKIAYITKKYISNKKTKIVKSKTTVTYNYSGSKLTRSNGVNQGPSGKETYYNLPMGGVIRIMKNQGYNYSYWVREDGVKMFGDYVIVAADLSIRPRGSLIPTSLGMGIVCDTGTFIYSNRTQLDIAVTW